MKDKKTAVVFHAQLWGHRKEKYDLLLENNIKTIKWNKLSPKSELYLFVPRDERLLKSYEKYIKINEVFPLNGVGMTTARDHFVIDKNKDTLINRIRLFKNSKYSDDDLHTFFQIKKKKGWSIRRAWNMLQSISDNNLNKFIKPVLYRPFDIQWIFYHNKVIERPRKEVMRHMMQENLGLCIGRAGHVVGLEKPWNIIFCSNCIVDFNLFYRGGNVNFPLYIYSDTDKTDLFSHAKKSEERQPNIESELFSILSEVYKRELTPEDIFYYIYAVLYSNVYRTKYAEFLKTDFPRIPFTKVYELFKEMVKNGKRLVDLHLLKSTELDTPAAKFQGKGDNKVEKLRYDEKRERVYFNQGQYFEGVKKEIWEYQIGGYQVCNKWLKDRKSRRLSLDDIKHYCKIVISLQKTLEIQKAIDDIFPEVEKDTLSRTAYRIP